MLNLPCGRMTMHPQKPGVLLADAGGIPALLPQARRLLQLRQMVGELLPHSLARSCSIANYKNGKIVFFARNSAVAAKLKLLRPTLCAQFSRRGVEVTGVEIEVQPPEAEYPAPVKTAHVTRTAAEALARLSAQLPDSSLKIALARLAAHHASKD